jgi:hypothetical protein
MMKNFFKLTVRTDTETDMFELSCSVSGQMALFCCYGDENTFAITPQSM